MKDLLRILHKSVMEGSLCAKGEKEKQPPLFWETPAVVWENNGHCFSRSIRHREKLRNTPRYCSIAVCYEVFRGVKPKTSHRDTDRTKHLHLTNDKAETLLMIKARHY